MVLLVGAAVWLSALGLKQIWSTFSGASDTIKAASIASVSSIFLLMVGRFFEQKRELRQRINSEKIAIYQKFFDFYFDAFSKQKVRGKKQQSDTTVQEMLEFQKNVVLWGSDAVIKSYLDFKDALAAFSANNSEEETIDQAKKLAAVLQSAAAVLTAMRRDVGYTFTSFTPLELGRLQLRLDDETKKVLEALK